MMNLAPLKHTALVLALFAGPVSPSEARDIAHELARLGFMKKEVPTPGSGAWRTANSSAAHFGVEKTKKLVVRNLTIEESFPDKVTFDAGAFRYIGINKGEFGGGLYVGEVDDKNLIFRGNVVALMPVGNDLYIFSGLCHLAFSGGAVHVIRNYGKPSPPTQITLLPDAPLAVSRDQYWDDRPSFAIAGCASLMIFVPDSALGVPVYDAFWASLYPNSIVKYNDHYVIGMRSGVAVVDKEFDRSLVRYFVPKQRKDRP